jgi:hypothetical protein
MNTFGHLSINARVARRRAANFVRTYRLVVPTAVVGLMLVVAVRAESPAPLSFGLAPPAGAVANCLPDASARVTLFAREDVRGVDTLDLKAEGLPPDTGFAVFLTELPGPPFGAVEYVGAFTTNAAGRGALRVDAVVEEAFSSTLVGGTRVRKELNHVVIWFADPAGDDLCFGVGGGVITPFDGDGVAGGTVLSSANFLPGAPLP